MKKYEFHEVASLFPLMSDEEFKTLVKDIKDNGLHESIYLYEGKIIDGRNRYKACHEAGVEPRFCDWDGNGCLVHFVVSLNMNRRHLTASHKAAASIEIERRFAAEAKKNQRMSPGRPKKGKELIPEPFTYNKNNNLEIETQQKEKPAQERNQEPAQTGDSKQNQDKQARDKAAELVGANPRYISDAKRIQKTHPEKLKEIAMGEKTIPQVLREIKTENKPKKPPVKTEKKRSSLYPSDSEKFAIMAISQLERIDPKCPNKKAAYSLVYTFMIKNLNGGKLHAHEK